jgi:hypothetical protein
MRRIHPFWLCFFVCFLATVALLVYPVYVIRPFRAQQPRELMIALAVLRYRPFAMALFFLASMAMLIRNWRPWRTLGVAAIAAVALLSRVNIYEKMFHPIDRATFSAADQTKLDGDEKVIAVTAGRAARAYPIRIISYHHVVNDVVEGEPIVATY